MRVARELADYLAGIPDDVKDDDEMVVMFCREAGIPVVGTVPHLVDHRFDPTIVGHPGRFHATVFLPAPVLSPTYWQFSASAEEALARRCRSDGSCPTPCSCTAAGACCGRCAPAPGTRRARFRLVLGRSLRSGRADREPGGGRVRPLARGHRPALGPAVATSP
ncbi:hypothetical protein V2I01_12225 [Micromonospora sp. BRA006-A]|nr:hypothetical protein [Micromonospora sp. BRA006-A]